jgi:hypothetical protein
MCIHQHLLYEEHPQKIFWPLIRTLTEIWRPRHSILLPGILVPAIHFFHHRWFLVHGRNGRSHPPDLLVTPQHRQLYRVCRIIIYMLRYYLLCNGSGNSRSK